MGSSPVSPTGRCHICNVWAGHGWFRVSGRSNRFIASFKPRLQPSLGRSPEVGECAKCAVLRYSEVALPGVFCRRVLGGVAYPLCVPDQAVMARGMCRLIEPLRHASLGLRVRLCFGPDRRSVCLLLRAVSGQAVTSWRGVHRRTATAHCHLVTRLGGAARWVCGRLGARGWPRQCWQARARRAR